MRLNPEVPQEICSKKKLQSLSNAPDRNGGTLALHLDFVAKPRESGELAGLLEKILADSKADGLKSGMLLISDREARLVSLVSFWDAAKFNSCRERRIASMQKLLAPFADGTVRAHTSVPKVLKWERVAQAASREPIEVSEPVCAGIAVD